MIQLWVAGRKRRVVGDTWRATNIDLWQLAGQTNLHLTTDDRTFYFQLTYLDASGKSVEGEAGGITDPHRITWKVMKIGDTRKDRPDGPELIDHLVQQEQGDRHLAQGAPCPFSSTGGPFVEVQLPGGDSAK